MYARCLKFAYSSSASESQNSTHEYYKGNRLLPSIPSNILNDFSNNGVVPLIMNAEKSHPQLIATTPTNPVQVENNVCFLVDLDQLEETEDILCDDLGSWDQSKTAVKKYLLITTGKTGKVT